MLLHCHQVAVVAPSVHGAHLRAPSSLVTSIGFRLSQLRRRQALLSLLYPTGLCMLVCGSIRVKILLLSLTLAVLANGTLVGVNINGQNDTLLPPLVGSERSRDNAAQSNRTRSSTHSTHWGYIAFFYLVEQMHRWERFVFRFDKQFPSIQALKSISGMHSL